MPSLTLEVADRAALHALFEEHLSKRRAFVPGASGLEAFMACELVLVHGGSSRRLPAEVVYVKAEAPGCGVGLSLAAVDAAAMEVLRAFVFAEDPEAADDEPRAPPSEGGFVARLRGLSSAEQQRAAATAGLSERIALERMYGPNIWETLLRNARITVPEVARIARKGTLPRPLVEVIAASATWLATAEVQRALLSNPRASAAVVMKVLHAMPRGTLTLVPQQTAYPMTVRAAAKKLLGSER